MEVPSMEVPSDEKYIRISVRKPMGQWLVENVPRGIELQIPDRNEPGREIPFIDPESE